MGGKGGRGGSEKHLPSPAPIGGSGALEWPVSSENRQRSGERQGRRKGDRRRKRKR